MNSKNIVPIKEEKIGCTCMKCLKEHKEEDMHIIHIPAMGYGSGFDGFDTLVILCDDCYKESIKEHSDFWDMKVKKYTIHHKKNDDIPPEEREKNKSDRISLDKTKLPVGEITYSADFDETFEEYLYENEMFDYIHKLPVEGRELVYNRVGKGRHRRDIDSQEWIDYHLGEASYEVCKKNYWVYKGEIEAYREKYEKCDHVADIIYKDGSGGSHCLIYPTVHGKRGGKCGGSYGCYECPYFKERKGDVRVFKHDSDIELGVKDNIDEIESKEKIEANIELGIRPTQKLERLSVFASYDGKDTEELVVIKIDGDKILATPRQDMRDVLHNKKEAKDTIMKWVSKDTYIEFLGNLIVDREKEIADIEKNGKLV